MGWGGGAESEEGGVGWGVKRVEWNGVGWGGVGGRVGEEEWLKIE